MGSARFAVVGKGATVVPAPALENALAALAAPSATEAESTKGLHLVRRHQVVAIPTLGVPAGQAHDRAQETWRIDRFGEVDLKTGSQRASRVVL